MIGVVMLFVSAVLVSHFGILWGVILSTVFGLVLLRIKHGEWVWEWRSRD